MSPVGQYARVFGEKHGRRRLAAVFSLVMLTLGSMSAVSAVEVQRPDQDTSDARAAIEKAFFMLADMMGLPPQDATHVLELVIDASSAGQEFHDEVNEVLESLPLEFN